MSEAYSSRKSYYGVLQGFSGIYNWLYTVGFNTLLEVYNFVITHEFLAATFIRIGNLHFIYSCQFTQWVLLNKGHPAQIKECLSSKKLALHIKVHPIFIWPCKFFVAYFDCLGVTFIHSCLFDATSGLWALHSINWMLSERPCKALASTTTHSIQLIFPQQFYTGDWLSYHSRILTWLGGLKSNSGSLSVRDIAHHHFGVALLFLWASSMSSGLYKAFSRLLAFLQINVIMKESNSVHLHLSVGHAPLSALVRLFAQILTPLTPYLYLSYDYLTSSALDLHHGSIALFLMIGSLAHGGIFLIREIRYIMRCPIGRILLNTLPIISHLT